MRMSASDRVKNLFFKRMNCFRIFHMKLFSETVQIQYFAQAYRNEAMVILLEVEKQDGIGSDNCISQKQMLE